MELFYRKIGAGTPLIICHGLYGMSENWLPIAKALSENFEVFLPDMRNHGLSPHSISHSYNDLCEDINFLIKKSNLSEIILIGHSMGGKACMQLCVDYPKYVKKLIVIDISPRGYNNSVNKNQTALNHGSILSFMVNFDFKKNQTRKEISDFIFNNFSDNFTRQFLIKNITKGENTSYRWKLNAKVLYEKHFEILKRVDFKNKKISCESLFIKGSNSNYIKPEDVNYISENFTNYKIASVKNSGHMIHADNPFGLITEIKKFLLK